MKKLSLLIIGMISVLVLVLAACGQAETPAATTTKPAATTAAVAATTTTTAAATQANWWDSLGTPKYGGSIHLTQPSDPLAFDPYVAQTPLTYVTETLGTTDWTLDRNIWNFQIGYTPLQYRTGLLAESWETPDLKTIIFHLRKGVHWEDKPPVNGREFDAYDVEYSYNRVCGLKGFAKPIGGLSATLNVLESITATDKYTVVFKFKADSGSKEETLLDDAQANACLVPREVIETYGDMNDWKNVVGLGPFILSDFVSNSYYTLSRNPNYWGFDERYPQNKVPYADEIKIHVISDESTRIAALRSGQIDRLQVDAEQAQSLAKTNPELKQVAISQRGRNIDFRCDVAPFNDIRVRKALQMAIDLPAMSKAYYLDDPTPYGLIGPALTGFYVPFAEWPKELQAEYTYNPEGAKKLLAEAGYPNGFKTNVTCINNASTIETLKIVQSYFKAIGVEMEIKPMEKNTLVAYLTAKKADAMIISDAYSAGMETPPNIALKRRVSGQGTNSTENNDPVFDAMYANFLAATTLEEQQKIAREADMYAIAQHWHVITVPQIVTYRVSSPKLHGDLGEFMITAHMVARWWKD